MGEVYVCDLIGGVTYWASAAAGSLGLSTYGYSTMVSCQPVINSNGQYVAFESTPSPSAVGSSQAASLILRYGIQTHNTDIVATNGDGVVFNYQENRNVDMTLDGRYVAYVANQPRSQGQIQRFIYGTRRQGPLY